jgi:hypothetical protein
MVPLINLKVRYGKKKSFSFCFIRLRRNFIDIQFHFFTAALSILSSIIHCITGSAASAHAACTTGSTNATRTARGNGI